MTWSCLLVLWLLAANLTAFALMGADKRRARRRGARRIPERRLFLAAALGGSAGAIAGMYVFHHKTRHRTFRWGLPAILLAQLAAAGSLWYFLR